MFAYLNRTSGVDKLVVVGDAKEARNALVAAAEGYDAGYRA